MRLYIKLALATGIPFGAVTALWSASALAAVVGGLVFGVLMSAVLGTLQLRADREADWRASESRRIRRKERDGSHAKPDDGSGAPSGPGVRDVP